MSVGYRPHLLSIKPYSPGKPIDEVKRELGLTEVVKLASNENPLGPSPKAIAAMIAAAPQMHLYPDAGCYDLRLALAEKHGLDMDQIVIGNGSDELIHLLGLALLDGPNSNLVMGDPSFVRYASSAELADSRLIKVPLDATWTHDASAMAEAMTSDTRIVYLANPNNPTGTVNSAADVDLLLEKLPEGAVLVLDEAYYEFGCHRPDFLRSVELLKQGKPVVILRTFSKAYGLAGIRIGYGFMSAELADILNRVREPFNVNLPAQKAAIAALEDQDHVANTIALNQQGIDRVTLAAEELGFKVVPSCANFLCIDLGQPSRPVFDRLLRQGIIVRPGDVLGMPHHLRVSIGTEAEMTKFNAAFRNAVLA